MVRSIGEDALSLVGAIGGKKAESPLGADQFYNDYTVAAGSGALAVGSFVDFDGSGNAALLANTTVNMTASPQSHNPKESVTKRAYARVDDERILMAAAYNTEFRLRVCNLTGETMYQGKEMVLATNAAGFYTQDAAVVPLGNDYFAVFYVPAAATSGNPYYVNAALVKVDGLTVYLVQNLGAISRTNGQSHNVIAAVNTDNTKIVFGYIDSASGQYSTFYVDVLTFNGSTLAKPNASPVSIQSSMDWIDIALVGPGDRFFVCGDYSNIAMVWGFDLVGNTITMLTGNAQLAVYSDKGQWPTIMATANNQAICIFSGWNPNAGSSGKDATECRTVVFTGSAWSVGTSVYYQSAYYSYANKLIRLSGNKGILLFRTSGGGTGGWNPSAVQVVLVAGTTFPANIQVTTPNANGYQDPPMGIVHKVSGNQYSFIMDNNEYPTVNGSTERRNYIYRGMVDIGTNLFAQDLSYIKQPKGMALQAAAAGQKAKVLFKGLFKPGIALNPTKEYFCSKTGSLQEGTGAFKIGVAISSTELLVKDSLHTGLILPDGISEVKRSFAAGGTVTPGKVVQVKPDGTIQNLPLVVGGMIIGIAQSSTSVILRGISTAHTGLVMGTDYYFDSNGNITTTSTGNTYIGRAISPTALLVSAYLSNK